VGFRGHQGGWVVRYFLKVFKGLLYLLSPLELVLFLEELKEWEPPDAELRDEIAQGSHTPRQLLDIIKTLGRLHFHNGRHLLWVRVDSTMGDHIPE
jgi:hypothetical protein